MVDWIETTGRCVYPEKMEYPTSPISAKWNTADEATTQDWLYDDQDVHLLNMPLPLTYDKMLLDIGAQCTGNPKSVVEVLTEAKIRLGGYAGAVIDGIK